jgi:hypothetical protein
VLARSKLSGHVPRPLTAKIVWSEALIRSGSRTTNANRDLAIYRWTIASCRNNQASQALCAVTRSSRYGPNVYCRTRPQSEKTQPIWIPRSQISLGSHRDHHAALKYDPVPHTVNKSGSLSVAVKFSGREPLCNTTLNYRLPLATLTYVRRHRNPPAPHFTSDCFELPSFCQTLRPKVSGVAITCINFPLAGSMSRV